MLKVVVQFQLSAHLCALGDSAVLSFKPNYRRDAENAEMNAEDKPNCTVENPIHQSGSTCNTSGFPCYSPLHCVEFIRVSPKKIEISEGLKIDYEKLNLCVLSESTNPHVATIAIVFDNDAERLKLNNPKNVIPSALQFLTLKYSPN